MKTLIVIDLQEWFVMLIKCPHDRDRLITNSVNEIREARRLRQRIIVLNYCDHGPLNVHIEKALAGYEDVKTLWKYEDDGGGVLHSYFRRCRGRLGDRHKVIGVNVTCCVGDTAHTMVQDGYDPVLLWGAVGDSNVNRKEQRAFIRDAGFSCRWK